MLRTRLYVYSAIAGAFKEGWIPQNYFAAIVVPKLQGHYGAICSLKPLNAALFGSQVFPDLLSYLNGIFVDTDYRFVPTEQVKTKLFKDHERVVFKVDGSMAGLAIHFFDWESFDVRKVRVLATASFKRS